MKKIFILTFLLVWGSTICFNAYSAQGEGTIEKLLIGRLGHQVLVKISGEVGSIGCRTRTDWHYFLDLNEPASK